MDVFFFVCRRYVSGALSEVQDPANPSLETQRSNLFQPAHSAKAPLLDDILPKPINGMGNVISMRPSWL